MNETMNHVKPGGDFVDGLLSRHFRSEMPDPWPECEALVEARRPQPRTYSFRAVGRFALAASIVLFFLGYLALADRFPRPKAKPQDTSGDIGSNPGLSHHLQPAPKR